MIDIKTSNAINFLKLCKQSQEIVTRLDYQYTRYNIKYTMCLIELNDELLKKEVNLKSYLRYTDEIANINNKYKFIFFAHTSISNTYKALLALEKTLIKKHNLCSTGLLFKASIIEKKRNNTSSEMISDLNHLLFNSYNSKDFIIMPEDCKNEY